MIDVATESLISIDAAATHQGRHRNTIDNWHNVGCRGVLLETVMIGGRRMTSIEAINRFHERVNRGKGFIGAAKANTDQARIDRELNKMLGLPS